MTLLGSQVVAWALVAFAAALAVTLLVGFVTRLRAGAGDPTHPRRHCKYCFWGNAELCEHTAHVEGDDLVEVDFFVCSMCGLPQWRVLRGPVLRKVG